MFKLSSRRTSKPGMHAILFHSLAFLSLCSILMIWIVLRQLLNIFFYNAQITELENASELISESIESDKLEKTCYTISMNSNACIRIFEIGSISTELITSDVQADCYIHHIPDEEFETYYEAAKQNGGTYIDSKSTSDILSGELDQSSTKRYSIIYCRIIDSADTTYLVMLDSRLNPTNSLNSLVINQITIISICILILTVIFALVLTRILTNPLKRMTVSAKQLALGNYDVEFNGGGYKETVALSEALNYASDELKKNDELQKELLANVSHDLRTPLTLIRGYAEMMHDIPDENTPENIQIIIDETTHLSQLVSDMLDLSKISSGAMLPNCELFDLTQSILETLQRYRKYTDKNGFTINFDPTSHVFVYADKSMILQVVYNFVNNAINYSGDIKEITVTQTIVNNNVTIAVSDKGDGIADDKLKFIWDRYYKLDKNHKSPSVGSGLGLSIAKQILKSHSAPFGVTSTVGVGSTFWFSLPIAYNEKS